jgi:hypothetical protein
MSQKLVFLKESKIGLLPIDPFTAVKHFSIAHKRATLRKTSFWHTRKT